MEVGGLVGDAWETSWAKDGTLDALSRPLGEQNGQLGSHLEASERQKETPGSPKPHPNGAQDTSKSIVQCILWPFFPIPNLH